MSRITQAFQAVDRADFLPPDSKQSASADRPLPIGCGQTNSQPSTVRMMLEWLDPQLGDKILDVGSGSGWTTALLAHIVGANGVVYAVEKVPELVEFGAANCQRAGVTNAQFFEAGGTYGLPEHAPYDRILVSAAAGELPEGLIDQLKIGGKLVIPVGNSIHVISKKADGEHETQEFPGFMFVPLVK